MGLEDTCLMKKMAGDVGYQLTKKKSSAHAKVGAKAKSAAKAGAGSKGKKDAKNAVAEISSA